jgi:hypothetical protein
MNASVRTATGAMRRRIAIAAINASAPTIAVFFGVWDSSASGTSDPNDFTSEWTGESPLIEDSGAECVVRSRSQGRVWR